MGNSQSVPAAELIYKAVAKNDSVELQRLCARNSSGNPEQDRVLLQYRDKEGRTPLILAASKNYFDCARVLLRNGADVHYVNTLSEGRSGSALHEAARNRYEALAELLLVYGANPFVANAANRTPLDEAVLAGAPAVVRAFQAKALWSGTVCVKTSKLAGLSLPYKPRWCVVLPHFPCPKAGASQPVRKQLWVFKDASAVLPKCRVWLDGSSTYQVNHSEAVLRLHTSHAAPSGDVYTRFDRGYCLYLRPDGTTDTAHHNFARLISLCNLTGVVTPENVQPQPSSASAGGGAPTLPPPAPAAPYSSPGSYPPMPPLVVFDGPGPLTAGLAGLNHNTTPVAAGPTGGSVSSAAGGLSPAASVRRNAQSEPGPRFGTSHGVVVSDGWVDSLHALPGETDSEFAARLASAISAATGQSQEGGPGGAGAACQTPPRPAARPTTDSESSPSLPMAPTYATGSTVQPQPSLPSPNKASEAPSAPPLATPSAAPPQASSSNDDTQCVICLSAPREAGFLHGATMHLCVCRECCKMAAPGMPCPLCRQPVERVINVFS